MPDSLGGMTLLPSDAVLTLTVHRAATSCLHCLSGSITRELLASVPRVLEHTRDSSEAVEVLAYLLRNFPISDVIDIAPSES